MASCSSAVQALFILTSRSCCCRPRSADMMRSKVSSASAVRQALSHASCQQHRCAALVAARHPRSTWERPLQYNHFRFPHHGLHKQCTLMLLSKTRTVSALLQSLCSTVLPAWPGSRRGGVRSAVKVPDVAGTLGLLGRALLQATLRCNPRDLLGTGSSCSGMLSCAGCSTTGMLLCRYLFGAIARA